tara:strand:+ start:90 stop:293 length:204 start_codon:yes stop_codon:yes gene_type:complete
MPITKKDLEPQLVACELATRLMHDPWLPVLVQMPNGDYKSAVVVQEPVELKGADHDQPEHIEALILK